MPRPTANAAKTVVYVIILWLSWIFVTRTVMFFLPAANSYTQGLLTGTIGTLVAMVLLKLLLRYTTLPLPVTQRQPVSRLFLLAGTGFIIGTLLFAIVIVGLVTLGHMQLNQAAQPFNPLVLLYFAGIIPLALMEEVIFRGKAFACLQASLGFQASQLIVATAFALYHISAHYSVAVAFTGPFMWAFVFGLAAAWSGSIATSTGLHVALNVWQVLLGMKGKIGAVWVLSFPAGYPQEMIKRTEHIGVLFQIVTGISALLAGMWWARKSKATAQQCIR